MFSVPGPMAPRTLSRARDRGLRLHPLDGAGPRTVPHRPARRRRHRRAAPRAATHAGAPTRVRPGDPRGRPPTSSRSPTPARVVTSWTWVPEPVAGPALRPAVRLGPRPARRRRRSRSSMRLDVAPRREQVATGHARTRPLVRAERVGAITDIACFEPMSAAGRGFETAAARPPQPPEAAAREPETAAARPPQPPEGGDDAGHRGRHARLPRLSSMPPAPEESAFFSRPRRGADPRPALPRSATRSTSPRAARAPSTACRPRRRGQSCPSTGTHHHLLCGQRAVPGSDGSQPPYVSAVRPARRRRHRPIQHLVQEIPADEVRMGMRVEGRVAPLVTSGRTTIENISSTSARPASPTRTSTPSRSTSDARGRALSWASPRHPLSFDELERDVRGVARPGDPRVPSCRLGLDPAQRDRLHRALARSDYLAGRPFSFVIALDADRRLAADRTSPTSRWTRAWALYEAWVKPPAPARSTRPSSTPSASPPSAACCDVLGAQLDPYYDRRRCGPTRVSLAALQARALDRCAACGTERAKWPRSPREICRKAKANPFAHARAAIHADVQTLLAAPDLVSTPAQARLSRPSPTERRPSSSPRVIALARPRTPFLHGFEASTTASSLTRSACAISASRPPPRSPPRRPVSTARPSTSPSSTPPSAIRSLLLRARHSASADDVDINPSREVPWPRTRCWSQGLRDRRGGEPDPGTARPPGARRTPPPAPASSKTWCASWRARA
jgi:hypothetical protein